MNEDGVDDQQLGHHHQRRRATLAVHRQQQQQQQQPPLSSSLPTTGPWQHTPRMMPAAQHQPQTQPPVPQSDDLTSLFKASARSVAQLYRASQQQYQSGYQQCLHDVLAFCMQHQQQRAADDQHHAMMEEFVATPMDASMGAQTPRSPDMMGRPAVNATTALPVDDLMAFLQQRFVLSQQQQQHGQHSASPASTSPVAFADVAARGESDPNTNTMPYHIHAHLSPTMVDQQRWRHDMDVNNQLIARALEESAGVPSSKKSRGSGPGGKREFD